MISALLAEERSLVRENYLSAGLEVTEHSNCLLVKEKEEIIARCFFELYEKGVLVLGLEPCDDIALADFTLRSALHVAAERCAMDARYADSAPVEHLKLLGFVIDENEKTLDIEKLFKSCSGCKCE